MVGTENMLDDAGAADLAEILRNHPKLVELNLWCNNIDIAGCGLLTDVLLDTVETLRSLDMERELAAAITQPHRSCGVLTHALSAVNPGYESIETRIDESDQVGRQNSDGRKEVRMRTSAHDSARWHLTSEFRRSSCSLWLRVT
jgi:hypothetical protein